MNSIGYVWGVLGDENIPIAVTMDDLLNHPCLAIDMEEFEADMNQSASSSDEYKPF